MLTYNTIVENLVHARKSAIRWNGPQSGKLIRYGPKGAANPASQLT